jgi:hypothetical protein
MVMFAMLMSPLIARADWLDDAWSTESVQTNGSPAITIRMDTVHIVLPAAVLRKAHDAGATIEQAINAFLGRYAPRCSDLLNFNLPHLGLKVELSLQNRVPFEEKSDDMPRLLGESDLAPSVNDEPRLFVASPEHFDLTIDYAPTHQVHCIVPNDEAPVS